MNLLEKYGFESELFETLKKQFLDKTFTAESNILTGCVEAPEKDAFVYAESLSHADRERFFKLGCGAVQHGELGAVVMNGGMATRFGGVVKGVVPVYDGKSFLQIKFEQVKRVSEKYGVAIPIYLMNSFATQDSTLEHLEKHDYFGYPRELVQIFCQFIFKRIDHSGNDFHSSTDSLKDYYSPGHGDFIYAVNGSKILESFRRRGGKYLWYSNVDNLGATLDETILGAHIESQCEMTAEMAEKYKGDKGGAPALVDKKIQIVEGFKFPKGFDQDTISVFNTATYIFNAAALYENRNVELPWYVVEKNVDDIDVIQFERLTGDLSIFLKTHYLVVERQKRFFPVKTPEDLELLRDGLRKIFG